MYYINNDLQDRSGQLEMISKSVEFTLIITLLPKLNYVEWNGRKLISIWWKSISIISDLYICCEDGYNEKVLFRNSNHIVQYIVNIPQVYILIEHWVHSMSKLISLLYEQLDYKYALQLFGVKYCLYVCISFGRIDMHIPYKGKTFLALASALH